MSDSVCANDNNWCQLVERITHNDGLARASDWLIAKPVKIITLVLIALVVRWLLHRLIDRITRTASDGAVPGLLARGKVPQMLIDMSPEQVQRRQQRAQTMASLLKSISSGVIFSILMFMVVAELGYNIGPLIASAGIIGVALGFGAQSLVKDFLSGIFMILEDQYGVGDLVDLGPAIGTVEAVGLRVTRVRGDDNTIWYVRNGEILRVGNRDQGGAGPLPASPDQPTPEDAASPATPAPTVGAMRAAVAHESARLAASDQKDKP